MDYLASLRMALPEDVLSLGALALMAALGLSFLALLVAVYLSFALN